MDIWFMCVINCNDADELNEWGEINNNKKKKLLKN